MIISKVKDVVELDGRWKESSRNLRVNSKCRFDKGFDNFRAVSIEFVHAQMLVEDLLVDGFQSIETRERNGENGEVSLKSRIDGERTSGRVHTRNVLTVVDFFERKFGSIIPVRVIQVLSNESVRLHSAVSIDFGHVHIVNEVDKSL